MNRNSVAEKLACGPARACWALLLLVPALPAAQSPIGYPRAGCFRDEAGLLRPVLGVAGNFVIGDAEGSGIAAAGCRGKLTLVKTEDAIELRDRESGRVLAWRAPEGAALFAFPENGAAPLVFFPETSQWLRAAEGAAARALPPIDGEPLAVSSSDGRHALMAVRREGGLFLLKILLDRGVVEEEAELAGVHAPVLLLGGGTALWGDRTDLVARAPDQRERRIALPAPAQAMEHLGEDWVRIVLESGGHMALRLSPGSEELYRLPEVAR